MQKIVTITLTILLAVPFFGFSQSFYSVRRDRNLILSGGTGVTKYYGELVNPNSIGKVRPNIYAGAEYLILPRISARLDATWFQLSGSDAIADASRRSRNLSFFSNNFEIDFTGSVRIFADEGTYAKRRPYNFYGLGGVGLLYFNPKTRYQGDIVALQPLQTEGVEYSKIQFVIPMGFGVTVKINPFINFALEGVLRKTFTDHLDDVSSFNYVDPATLLGGVDGLSAKLADRRGEFNPDGDYTFDPANPDRRGNPETDDSYFIVTAKLQFYVPTKFGASKKLYNTKRKGSKSSRTKGGMYKVRKGAYKRR
ncbi:hypothetical protein SanaruYs_07880 [Chryseotalea sanaruensis]|uniref:Outer membrane protein beta-barrel domain-containing protein n=1 Tax=Chryseotalea sanaruensis TaxID=2482724 RepID=A0A401U6N3_9BACT|nr:hypothetical protein [Chryseotalea sanaruensis]GCC50573.1 hypothetical protein SanaruYs_07880 [Chryseotalea sanaruensis]